MLSKKSKYSLIASAIAIPVMAIAFLPQLNPASGTIKAVPAPQAMIESTAPISPTPSISVSPSPKPSTSPSVLPTPTMPPSQEAKKPKKTEPKTTTKKQEKPKKDDCPNGDYTNSNLDGKCGKKPVKTSPTSNPVKKQVSPTEVSKPKANQSPKTKPTEAPRPKIVETPKTKDSCPNGDYTKSRYDGKCGEKPADKTPVQPKPTSSPSPTKSSKVLWTDKVAGWLPTDQWRHVPCGGLWNYVQGNYYVRESTCSGSKRYLSLNIGDKVSFAGKTCTMSGSQRLNYNVNNMGDLAWKGNTAVQTCDGAGGPVKIIYFNCS